MGTSHDLRCDRNPSQLLAKLVGDTVEIACKSCRRDLGARLVVHRYDWQGTLVATEVTMHTGRRLSVLQ